MPPARIAAALLLPALVALAVLGAAGGAGRAEEKLAPRQGWRIGLDAGRVAASVDPAGAAAVVTDAGGRWPAARAAPAAGPVWLAVALPEAKEGAVLLVVEVEAAGGAVPVVLEGAARADGPFAEIEKRALAENRKGKRDGPRIAHLTVPKGRATLFRVTLGEAGRAPPTVARVRAYALDPKGRNDYWLFLGASLETGAIDGDAFAADIRARHPGHDPYVANEAVSGWTAGALRKALPEILAGHPHARYVPIHIGGNDVTSRRPYPGGADKLRADLEAILDAVRAAGKVPILARLSYRAYKAAGEKPGVPPDENGSGPYVEAIFDPLIKEFCPDFFDRKTGRGRVDLYEWFRAHPDELGPDGIHLKPAGNRSTRRIWVESAGDVVYGRPK